MKTIAPVDTCIAVLLFCMASAPVLERDVATDSTVAPR